jgi:formylmethanofuran dehydrogenase subunit B
VVVWRADPVVTNPRLLERLRLERATRGPRALVVVDAQPTATAEEADAFVELDAADDFEALWALRALVAGAPLDRNRIEELPLNGLDDLAERLLGGRHVALIYGAVDELSALALFSLVRDLSRDRHAVTLGLRRDGNARGAEDVLAWQTGFPAAVSFARGYPHANPGELSAAALLERGEVDAALVVASDPLEHLPAAAAERLRELPTVVVDARATATSQAARVAFATAADGIEVPGTVHRMDGVPVPLRAPLPGERPRVEDVLAAIEGRL